MFTRFRFTWLLVAFGLSAGAYSTSFARDITIGDNASCRAAGFTPGLSGKVPYCVMTKNYVLSAGDKLIIDPSLSNSDYFLTTSAFSGVALFSNVTINGTLELRTFMISLSTIYDGYLFIMGSSSGGLRQDTVTVASGGKVSVWGNIHNRGRYINQGTTETINMGFRNHDVIFNCGSFVNDTGGTLNLNDSSTDGFGFRNAGPCTSAINTTLFINNGTITTTSGQINLMPLSSFQNSGTISITNYVWSDYAIVNRGGTLTNSSGATITIASNNYGLKIQSGMSATNSGTITNNSDNGVLNCGTWTGPAPTPITYVTSPCSTVRLQ
jgi:hypothetical protein